MSNFENDLFKKRRKKQVQKVAANKKKQSNSKGMLVG